MKNNKRKAALICFFDFVVSYNTGTIKVHVKGVNQKIVENLKDTYILESTASVKHVAFAKRNSEERYLRVALLHAAASKTESAHTSIYKAVLKQLSEKYLN